VAVDSLTVLRLTPEGDRLRDVPRCFLAKGCRNRLRPMKRGVPSCLGLRVYTQIFHVWNNYPHLPYFYGCLLKYIRWAPKTQL